LRPPLSSAEGRSRVSRGNYSIIPLTRKTEDWLTKMKYMKLGIIKRNFIYISRNCFVTLYKSLVRSHLKYANNSIWHPKKLMLTNWNKFNQGLDYLIRTRGNRYKLIQHHCHYDLRKFNFTNRVIPIWNSLSDYVVLRKQLTLLRTG